MADIDDIVSAALRGAPASGPERARARAAWAAARAAAATQEAALDNLLVACRRDGWADTARAVLAAVGDRFPGAACRLVTELWLAEHGRDHVAALLAAQALSVAAPNDPAGPIGVATALAHMGRAADADRAVQAAQAAFPGKPPVWQASAEIAELRGDVAAALERWSDMRAKFPNSSAGYIGALRTLREARRLDQAPALLAAGLEAFPDDRELLTAAARTAESAQNVDQAHAYWQRLVELAPGNPRYALMAALSLMGGRAGRAKRLPEILRLLDALHADFPDFAPAYAAHLDCLVSAGRAETADALAPDWHARFPDHADIALARAHIAAERGRPDEAVRLIEGLRDRVPPTPAIEGAYIKALSATGALDRAEAVCESGMAKFPGARRLLSEYARLATRRGDWHTAQARLQDALRQWPADAGLAKELLHTRIQLAGQTESENAAPPAEGDAALFAHFESLGGSFLGCEFGTVQRSFGTESLGLLRWTRITAEDLTRALAEDFEGVGSEESTILKTVRNAANVEEYVTADRRFGMKSNTFMKVSDAPYEKMFAQTCRRLRFLRGRLLEDLRLAEKIFVYKAFHPLAEGAIRKLHEAIRRHGDVALLCVMKQDERNPKGTVIRLAPGLYLGYVGFFMKDADKNPGSDRSSWHGVCTRTLELFEQDRAVAKIDAAA
jgi:tetratricopeptide (TPR) repeat protein